MRFSSFIAGVIALAADAPPPFTDKPVALAMGNAAHRSMAQRQNRRNGAADVSAALQRLDFEAVAATDLDRSSMSDPLDRFSAGGRGSVGLRAWDDRAGADILGANLPVDNHSPVVHCRPGRISFHCQAAERACLETAVRQPLTQECF
jgi:hypothetical protein